MEYMRFMGTKELTDLISGRVLQNSTDWRGEGWSTGSVGFCFFDCDEPAEKRLHYMVGMPSWVVEFESDIEMRKSYGRYRDPDADDVFRNACEDYISRDAIERLSFIGLDFQTTPVQRVAEYSIRQYDRKALRIVRIGAIVPDSREGRRIEWLSSEMELADCSSCGCVYRWSEAAISRRTGDRICPVCGTKEAVFDALRNSGIEKAIGLLIDQTGGENG